MCFTFGSLSSQQFLPAGAYLGCFKPSQFPEAYRLFQPHTVSRRMSTISSPYKSTVSGINGDGHAYPRPDCMGTRRKFNGTCRFVLFIRNDGPLLFRSSVIRNLLSLLFQILNRAHCPISAISSFERRLVLSPSFGILNGGIRYLCCFRASSLHTNSKVSAVSDLQLFLLLFRLFQALTVPASAVPLSSTSVYHSCGCFNSKAFAQWLLFLQLVLMPLANGFYSYSWF